MSNVYKIWQMLRKRWQRLIYKNCFSDIYFYQEDDGDDADGGNNTLLND